MIWNKDIIERMNSELPSCRRKKKVIFASHLKTQTSRVQLIKPCPIVKYLQMFSHRSILYTNNTIDI